LQEINEYHNATQLGGQYSDASPFFERELTKNDILGKDQATAFKNMFSDCIFLKLTALRPLK